MFAILFRALAKPGNREHLLEFLKKNSKYCKDYELGTLNFDILPDPANENAFYVYEAYEDCEAFKQHQKNPPYKEWDGALKKELVAESTDIFKGQSLCSPRAGKTLEEKLQELSQLALIVATYLVVVSIVAFFSGWTLLGDSDKLYSVLALGLIGLSGSSVAALTSCLDRYAKGFELEDGTKFPKEAEGETFNRRMARWFIFRPFLGFLMAPVFIWGMKFFVNESANFTTPLQGLAFSAFLGGLLAKSVIDLFKGLFKNVFKG